MKKNDSKLKAFVILLIAWIYFFYAAVDIIHYVSFRAESIYPPVIELPYESHVISYLKWILSLLCFMTLYMHRSGNTWALYLSWTSSVIILMLFVFKGQFKCAMVGSVVFRFGLLEIAAIGTMVYSIFFFSSLNLSWPKLSLGVFVAAGIYVVLLRSLPDFILLEQ